MKQCAFFGICGGCKYDFADASYREKKLNDLRRTLPDVSTPVWTDIGARRRADFSFAAGKFGFFETKSKNIIPITQCAGLCAEINDILPMLAALPWVGSGSALVTKCDNGIDLAITSDVPYFTPEFQKAVAGLPLIRVVWNGKTIVLKQTPRVSFGDISVEYPPYAFLQPSVDGANHLRDLVTSRAAGARHVADLFCGLGNFTFAVNADGFDIVGTGQTRDLFKNPLRTRQLNQYDCVIMDPPRAGAMAQCEQLAASDVHRVIYVSCNPTTFARDMRILTHGGYKLREIIPVDQFVGSAHWETFAVFDK